jgi:protein ImuA
MLSLCSTTAPSEPPLAKSKGPAAAALRLASPSASDAGKQPPDHPPEKLLPASGFHELLAAAPGDESAALAFAFSLATRTVGGTGQSLCFCSLASEAQERGTLYGHGLARLGIALDRLLMVSAAREKDLLWTLEEAVGSGAFGAVIGALGPQERLYAFGASRRLKLRVTAKKTPLFLIRHWQSGGATAAEGRWRISAQPSRTQGRHAGDQLLGLPRLQLCLERMASFRPQRWEMEFDAARDFHMASLLENGPDRGAGRRRRQAA